MPQGLFEIACVAIVVVTLVSLARRQGAWEVLAAYVSLALAGWVAEESCILAYRFYAYSDVWSVRVHLVPLLVPLIWPLVILSGRDFVQAVWPDKGWLGHLLVGLIVAFDASLVEVVAVRAGLWSWAEPGHLGVPVIGMLGWGYFAVGASAALSMPVKWRYPSGARLRFDLFPRADPSDVVGAVSLDDSRGPRFRFHHRNAGDWRHRGGVRVGGSHAGQRDADACGRSSHGCGESLPRAAADHRAQGDALLVACRRALRALHRCDSFRTSCSGLLVDAGVGARLPPSCLTLVFHFVCVSRSHLWFSPVARPASRSPIPKVRLPMRHPLTWLRPTWLSTPQRTSPAPPAPPRS